MSNVWRFLFLIKSLGEMIPGKDFNLKFEQEN